MDGIVVPIYHHTRVHHRPAPYQPVSSRVLQKPRRSFLTSLVSGLFIISTLLICITGAILFILSRSYHLFSVLSGSMEPTIHTGSLIAVLPKKTNTYNVGDIIAFHSSSGVITHRIVEVVDATYRTKGDANTTVDTTLVKPSNVIGSVHSTIPYIGYVMMWLRTKLGFSLLLLLPMSLVILQEVRQIRRAWSDIRFPNIVVGSSISLGVIMIFFIPPTYAVFNDTTIISPNRILTAAVFPTPTITPSPTPLPTATTSPTPTTDPCGNSSHTITQMNQNTGSKSRNTNQATITVECENNVDEDRDISNDVDIHISTGNNHTTSGTVTSGSVDMNIQITNH